MDDFVLLARTKQECIYLKKNITNFLEQSLHLKLNENIVNRFLYILGIFSDVHFNKLLKRKYYSCVYDIRSKR